MPGVLDHEELFLAAATLVDGDLDTAALMFTELIEMHPGRRYAWIRKRARIGLAAVQALREAAKVDEPRRRRRSPQRRLARGSGK